MREIYPGGSPSDLGGQMLGPERVHLESLLATQGRPSSSSTTVHPLAPLLVSKAEEKLL